MNDKIAPPAPWSWHVGGVREVSPQLTTVAIFAGADENAPIVAKAEIHHADLISALPEALDFVAAFTSIAGQALLLSASNGEEIYDSACRIMKKARGEA